jgi:hypothetical protein
MILHGLRTAGLLIVRNNQTLAEVAMKFDANLALTAKWKPPVPQLGLGALDSLASRVKVIL